LIFSKAFGKPVSTIDPDEVETEEIVEENEEILPPSNSFTKPKVC
jgi:hypothetical protein